MHSFLQQRESCLRDRRSRNGKERTLQVVKSENNPPNCPQRRPIQSVWSILKQLVYENEYQETSREDLVQRIKHCVKNVDVEVIKKMKNCNDKRWRLNRNVEWRN